MDTMRALFDAEHGVAVEELREIRAVVRGIPKATGAGWPAEP
jgi:hypothetical protein